MCHARKNIIIASVFVLLLFQAISVRAEDWPQWLGPNRDSIWRESGILEKFPTEGPPVRWRAPIGAGYSGPIVAKGRVYLTDRRLAQDASNPADAFQRSSVRGFEEVLCFDETEGKLLWKREYECPYTVSYPAGPRVAPLVHKSKVYTLGAEGNLFCLDVKGGEIIWSRDLKKDFNVKTPMWGFAAHPLVDGDRLICLIGGARTTVVALDKNTGKEIWRALSADEPGYSSPVIVEAGGKHQLIVFHAEAVNSLNPETGQLYWSVPFKSNSGLSVATPRKIGDYLFFTSFYNGSLVVRLDSTKPDAALVWRTQKASEKDTTHLNSILCTPFAQDGYIYGVCSYGQLRCLKADTGDRVWETLKATTTGEPVRWANAFIVKNQERFFLFNEKGDLIIARLSPSGYDELSRAHLLEPTNKDCGRPVVWSHPAFADRCCFARNDRELICVDLALRK
ncbi:MAG TPA: PQQ-binding-like beta-propeller repeat protein [Candidatus Limnocylindrales bacterium]|jgi:outer membrane protein assembly factor BamB|nr:PQQ-binding-like beta-propeller repeat protein [Candidatus Limnocylindrales bacterium]